MEKLSLAASLQAVATVRQQLEELFGYNGDTIYVGFTDKRAAALFDILPSRFKISPILSDADVFLSLDTDYEVANEHDLPMVELDLTNIVLAWEETHEIRNHQYIENIAPAITGMLQFISGDAEREGLSETPKRVAKAWAKWTEGYSMDAAEILKVFEDGAEKCDEMVIVKDIPIYSHCEHHLAAIFGTATIAYIPNGKIVGLSKLSRLADMFARHLQVQERLTNQIADALEEHLGAIGVGVVIRARHMCMESRGVCQQGHHTITSALRGVLKDNECSRAEFMALANNDVTV